MLRDLLTLNVFALLLIFARLGSAVMLMPGFSSSSVNARTRLLFALAVSFVVMPVLSAELPGLPGSVPGLFLLLGGEVIVGSFFGLIGRFVISALQTAGTVIAYISSMANALVQDPVTDQQSSTLAGFLGNMGLLMLFVTDTHHMMLRAVVDSYGVFDPGAPLMFGDFSQMLTRRLADSFALGVQMAAPLFITAFTYYIGLGILSRLMPNLQVFFIGMPVQILIQLSVLLLALSGMMIVFLNDAQDTFANFLVF